MEQTLIGIFGFCFFLLVAWIFSRNRRLIEWKTVFWGVALQFIVAIGILGIPRYGVPGLFRFVFDALNLLVGKLISFSETGAEFVFGSLARTDSSLGFIFAFRALPTIIFFSAFTAVLFHLGILQKIVRAIAWVMYRSMKSSGAESLSTASNIFLGQTEAPLLVKPYIPMMTLSEIYCVMVGGMATVATGVMGAYVGLLQSRMGDIAGHLLTASAMAAPAAILVSKMIVPEVGHPVTAGKMEVSKDRIDSNVLEAAARGASEGLMLALNVAAMLIAFIALIAVLDSVLGYGGRSFGFGQWGHVLAPAGGSVPEKLSLSLIFGWVFAPVAWLMGIPWREAPMVGQLLGEKIVLNEFVAYVHLAKLGDKLSDRSLIIASYALCGFANFSSIGIQIGGLGTIAPNQKASLARLGLLAVLGGSLATFMIACVAGLLY